MRMTLVKTVGAGFGLVLLAGCSWGPKVPTTVDVPGMPNAELALRESFRQVDTATASLGTLARTPPPRSEAPVVPAELQKIVSFTWQGPLDGAVRQLADTIGYTVTINAPDHSAPLPIGVNTGPKQIVEILRDLGDAAGSKATVEVDPLHHQIQVIHHV
jgi:defect-in-organelle-trafficking protein DotD